MEHSPGHPTGAVSAGAEVSRRARVILEVGQHADKLALARRDRIDGLHNLIVCCLTYQTELVHGRSQGVSLRTLLYGHASRAKLW